MAHDVFISYSTHARRDRSVANAVCAKLEQNGIRCWIAPRDPVPGENWPRQIVEAIEHCRVLVLVFSSHSNVSAHVMRELEIAVNKGVTILPFRIDDTPMSKEMEFLISVPHWLNALTPPLEKHIQHLVSVVSGLLLRAADSAPVPVNKSLRWVSGHRWPLAGAATLTAIMIVSLVVTAYASQHHDRPSISSAGALTATVPSGSGGSPADVAARVQTTSTAKLPTRVPGGEPADARVNEPDRPFVFDTSGGSFSLMSITWLERYCPKPGSCEQPRQDYLFWALTIQIEPDSDMNAVDFYGYCSGNRPDIFFGRGPDEQRYGCTKVFVIGSGLYFFLFEVPTREIAMLFYALNSRPVSIVR